MPTCPHPKPRANVGTRSGTNVPAARAWCPACKADTGWLDGPKDIALAALAKLKPSTQDKPEA